MMHRLGEQSEAGPIVYTMALLPFDVLEGQDRLVFTYNLEG